MTSCQNFTCPTGKTLISNPASQICNNNQCSEEQCCIPSSQITLRRLQPASENTIVPVLSDTLLFNQGTGETGASCSKNYDCLSNYCYSGRCSMKPNVDPFKYNPVECAVRSSCELGVACSSDSHCFQPDENNPRVCNGMIVYEDGYAEPGSGVCGTEDTGSGNNNSGNNSGNTGGSEDPGDDELTCYQTGICNIGVTCYEDTDCLSGYCLGGVYSDNQDEMSAGECSYRKTDNLVYKTVDDEEIIEIPNEEETDELPENSHIIISFDTGNLDISTEDRTTLLSVINEIISDELDISIREVDADNIEPFTVGSSKVTQLLEIDKNPDEVNCEDINKLSNTIEETILEMGLDISLDKTKCFAEPRILGLSKLHFGILVGAIILVIIGLFIYFKKKKKGKSKK